MRYLVFVAALLIPSIAYSAEPTEEEWQQAYERKLGKLAVIDAEIRKADDQKTSGLIKVGVGGAVMVGSAVAFFPGAEVEYDSQGHAKLKRTGNEGLFYGGILLGGIVETWGWWQWVDGFATANALKHKRIDVQFSLKEQAATLAYHW